MEVERERERERARERYVYLLACLLAPLFSFCKVWSITVNGSAGWTLDT